jgi:Uma2 family endonuclease
LIHHRAYWTLDTFAEYILIDQYRIHVEYFRRVTEKQWELLVFTRPDDIVALKSIRLEISLNHIYRAVVWDE